VATGVVIGGLLLFALSTLNIRISVFCGIVALFLVVFSRLCLRGSLKDLEAGPKWFLTDQGFLRVYSAPPEQEAILWEQIQHMAWLRYKGLVIRWKESGQRRGQRFREEFKESFLAGQFLSNVRLGQTEAIELISLWRKKCPATQTNPPLNRSSTVHILSRKGVTSIYGLMALGATLFCMGGANLLRQYPSCTWPSVEGKIVSQQFRLLPKRRNDLAQMAELELAYEYIVAGHAYNSDRFSLWREHYRDLEGKIISFAKLHPQQSIIKIYYNPKSPAQAVWLTGPDWRGNSSFMLLGSLFIAVALLVRSMFLKLGAGSKSSHGDYTV
jgi:hypothetical protein